MTILIVDNLGKSFGAHKVFGSLSFTVARGEVMCVIGRNGEGKTTLLRTLAGETDIDQGSFHVVGRRRLGYLSQDVPSFSRTVLEEMLASRKDIARLGEKMRSLEQTIATIEGPAKLQAALDEYARVTHRFEGLDGYAFPAKAKSILFGLGFPATDLEKQPENLSGGEKIRLALAKLLLKEPDLLLLDEPTNHLDLSGIEWLEKFLIGYKGAVLMVSHDRRFIDQVACKVLEMDRGESAVYRGNYTSYLAQKEAEQRLEEEAYRRQQELIARTKAFIQKWKATPTRKNQAVSREKMLARLDVIDKPKAKARFMNLRFDFEQESGEEVLFLDGVSKAFPSADGTSSRLLWKDFTWLVRREDRIALVGPNGCGKTTLLRCILGLDEEYEGAVGFGHGAVAGHFSQGFDTLDEDKTVLGEIRALGLANQEARDLLGRFLFSGEDALKTVAVLSGGERNRLSLAKLVAGKANVLLLDEPTNHLDMPSREVLEGALADFPGTLIFASHDRFFIDRLATHVWVFSEQRIRVWKGAYSDYRQKIDAGEEPRFENDLPSFAVGAASPGVERRPEAKPKTAAKISSRRPGGTRKQVEKELPCYEKELHDLESRIEALEGKRDELVGYLNDPASYEEKKVLPFAEYGSVENELAELYKRWESLAKATEGTKAEKNGAKVNKVRENKVKENQAKEQNVIGESQKGCEGDIR